VELPPTKVRGDPGPRELSAQFSEIGDPQGAGHLRGARSDHTDAPAGDVDVERVGAGVHDVDPALGGGTQQVAHAGRGARGGHGTRR
jgi:hypothetical protein